MIRQLALLALFLATPLLSRAEQRPNIILVMPDDMGWGQTGYYQHPVLKTPHLDAMAANGLRLDRFYAGAPNCSPTRATVLTGRSNDRTGVKDHGFPLRLQEKSIVQALRESGYATGHFGKWHLNGLSGPGVPILQDDERTPGAFGFDTWLSVTNFFDRNPILSRNGEFEEFEGDSSEIIVGEALKFIDENTKSERPFFVAIWYGSPHSPFFANESDRAAFADLDELSQNHYGELVAMDRSLGTLRAGLRERGIADNTLVWFNSDNGGLPEVTPSSVGELRGFKGTLYEGGLRVPAVIEWPAQIKGPRLSTYLSGTVDIYPTLADIAGLPESALPAVRDGISLLPLFANELPSRQSPLGFRHKGRGAWIEGDFKLVTQSIETPSYELYNLARDPNETTDLASTHPDDLTRLVEAFTAWNEGVEASVAGKDYPEGRVTDAITERRNWPDLEIYSPWFEQWKDRPEFSKYLEKAARQKERKKARQKAKE